MLPRKRIDRKTISTHVSLGVCRSALEDPRRHKFVHPRLINFDAAWPQFMSAAPELGYSSVFGGWGTQASSVHCATLPIFNIAASPGWIPGFRLPASDSSAALPLSAAPPYQETHDTLGSRGVHVSQHSWPVRAQRARWRLEIFPSAKRWCTSAPCRPLNKLQPDATSGSTAIARDA